MAKNYRTERDPLSIHLKLDIPEKCLPEGIDTDTASTIKISAYPVVWRQLEADLNITRRLFEGILKDAVASAVSKLPIKKDYAEEGDMNFESLSGVQELVYEQEREERGIYKRGRKAAIPETYKEMNQSVQWKWLHALFRYYKDKKDRPQIVQNIYDARHKKHGSRTKDPNQMTYFCCAVLCEENFTSCNYKFAEAKSFRTGYLKGAGRFRPLNNASPENIIQYIDDPEHPLHIIHKICRKLQK